MTKVLETERFGFRLPPPHNEREFRAAMIGFPISGAFRTWQIEEATGLSFISEKGVRITKKSYIVIHARETDCRELGVEGQTTKTV